MLKISQFPHWDAVLAHRFFPNCYNLICKSINLRKRTRLDTTCNSRIAKIFPCLAGISIGKLPSGEPKTLWWPLFTGPYLSSPSLISCKSGTLRKRVAQAFQWYQDHRNPTSGAMSIVCAKTCKNKENTPKIWHVFPPGQLPSCADSFRLAAIWSTSLGA